MSYFSSGVKRYIRAVAVVETLFPVDWRDSAEIASKHCNYYVRATQRCGLTQEVVNFPERYVGECCPLEEVKEASEDV